nr:hypothetical protein [Tanacetum cinerariifolium]
MLADELLHHEVEGRVHRLEEEVEEWYKVYCRGCVGEVVFGRE